MNDSYVVHVSQEKDRVRFSLRFVFCNMADAMEFAETCIECGEDSTEVNIRRESEE